MCLAGRFGREKQTRWRLKRTQQKAAMNENILFHGYIFIKIFFGRC
jgi:hypothetical protein